MGKIVFGIIMIIKLYNKLNITYIISYIDIYYSDNFLS